MLDYYVLFMHSFYLPKYNFIFYLSQYVLICLFMFLRQGLTLQPVLDSYYSSVNLLSAGMQASYAALSFY